MKRNYIPVGLLLMVAATMPLQSCIGSFSLTSKVLKWNNQVGSKFLNELVFFAFWILPVYEVTAAADLLVINSIEFWSGNSPLEAYTKVVDTDHGQYLIACDIDGYKITDPRGNEFLISIDDTDTWSIVLSDGKTYPFMTMIDASHVKMITPSGNFRLIELSESGVMAYSNEITDFGNKTPDLPFGNYMSYNYPL